MNQAPCTSKMISPLAHPACMHLRNACDTSFSYDSLRKNLRKWKPMTPFLSHIIGTRREQQCLIQHAGNYFWENKYSSDSGYLAQTNHFQGSEEGDDINMICGADTDCDRLYRLRSRLKRGGHKNLKDGFRLLRGEPLTWECTIQQMVMRPATDSLNLRVQA